MVDAIAVDDQGNEHTITYQVTSKCYHTVNSFKNDNLLCDNIELNDTPQNNCIEALILNATLDAEEAYNLYLEQVKEEFWANYIAACTQVQETYNYQYAFNRYHTTLFYYDRAGNRMRTVPPAGVQPLSDVQVDDIVNNGSIIYPGHTHNTNYTYNSLNQNATTTTPDGGTTRMWYDAIGRPAVSQNARQADFTTNLINSDPFSVGASIPTYNYTRYDYLGRVVETAEFMQNEPMNNAVTKDPAALEAWLEPANTPGRPSTRWCA